MICKHFPNIVLRFLIYKDDLFILICNQNNFPICSLNENVTYTLCSLALFLGCFCNGENTDLTFIADRSREPEMAVRYA